MNPNASSPREPATSPAGTPAGPDGLPAGLERLAAAIAGLAADDLDQLGGTLLAAQVPAMRQLVDQLEADWLRRLATVDGLGAAGAEVGACAPSTAGWLRATTRMSSAAAGPVLVDAARRLDPARLRRVADHLRGVLDPEGSEDRGRARLERRGLWLAATFDGMVDVKGLLDPEAGEAAMAALAPLARPTGPDDDRSAAQRRADAFGELARGALQAGHLPDAGGLRPQLAVTADLASLLAQQGGVGGTGGWGAVLGGETARRLACDAAVTRRH